MRFQKNGEVFQAPEWMDCCTGYSQRTTVRASDVSSSPFWESISGVIRAIRRRRGCHIRGRNDMHAGTGRLVT